MSGGPLVFAQHNPTEIHLFMTPFPLRLVRFRSQSRTSVVSHATQSSGGSSPSRRVGRLRRELESQSGFNPSQSEAVIDTVDDVVNFATGDMFERILKGQVSQATTCMIADLCFIYRRISRNLGCVMVEFHSIYRRSCGRLWRSSATEPTSLSREFVSSPYRSCPTLRLRRLS